MHPPPAEFFTRFLAGHMDRPLLDGYDGLSAEFCIHFRDLGEHWNLRLQGGQIVAITSGAAARGSVCFVVDAPAFWEIVSARLSPQVAFFTRRTDIRGDLFLGMKLAKVLGLFFAKFRTMDNEYLGETLAVETEPGVILQATVGYRDDTPLDRMLVIFPPHPSLGGDSANNVVAALFRQAVAMRVLAVTFDYRGVREGSVHGTHVLAYWDRLDATKDYRPITRDALHVIRRVRESFNPAAALWFAAYSFGNLVALAVAQELEVRGQAGISPPVLEYDLRPLLSGQPSPIFWIAPGDIFCPAGALDGLSDRCLTVREFPSEDHFFRGAEAALARRVLRDLLGDPHGLCQADERDDA